MILVDGRQLAKELTEKLQNDIKASGRKFSLTIFACDPNFETRKFLAAKKKRAVDLGVAVEIILLERSLNTEEFIAAIKAVLPKTDGVIVQLPSPEHLDSKQILASVPKEKDVDVFGYVGEETEILPPVVGAIAEIAKRYQITWLGKKVVVFGEGRLVGAPAKLFGQQQGAEVKVITSTTPEIEMIEVTKTADIIILGVGKPHLVTAKMVKEGVVIFDAGTSEEAGELVGDADPSVASKAQLLTPVPGGIGPLTVALLFRNLFYLAKNN